jgi:hypothetical protein
MKEGMSRWLFVLLCYSKDDSIIKLVKDKEEFERRRSDCLSITENLSKLLMKEVESLEFWKTRKKARKFSAELLWIVY